MARQWEPLDGSKRSARDDLFAAFVMAGWERFMPLEEAERAADLLAASNAAKAWKLSGHLMRGEPMPPEIAEWVRSLRQPYPASQR